MNTLRRLLILGFLCVAPAFCGAQYAACRQRCVQAGSDATVQAPGTGSTTLYLFGPGGAGKWTVGRGTIKISERRFKDQSGRYTVILDGNSASFFVKPAKAGSDLLRRPSFAGACCRQRCGAGFSFPLRSFSESCAHTGFR